MSKISEKNLVWGKAPSYWKQFVGWVISLRNKYISDIFFRTEFNVISLQVFFTIVLSLLFAVSFNYLYKDILQTIIDGIQQNITSSGTFTSLDIINSIQAVRAKNFLGFFSIAVSITLIFGYIIARATLSPTRNALKSQKRFVSDIAHELRTPLSVIKTNSEVALLEENINPKIKKIFLNNIDELDRVSVIINNLLTFNTLVHPEQIKFAIVDLCNVVDLSIKKLKDLAEQRKVKLIVIKNNPCTVFGNVIALEQITINLIKNAINYNHEGGIVTVTVQPDYRGNIVLSVEDNGMGISKEDLKHIFEPFYRAETSRSRQHGSSGLGLTIVSELVKLHSGRVSVVSRLKEGTTVTIILPYSKDENGEISSGDSDENEVSVDFLKKK